MEIQLISSLCYSMVISTLYVLSLYCWPNAKHRDDPTTIKRRFVSVIVTIIIATLLVNYVDNCWPHHNRVCLSLLAKLGLIWPKNYWNSILLPLMHTTILFMGPIVLFVSQIRSKMCFNSLNLIIVRNYIIAPITEEFIFRGVLSALLLNSWSHSYTITISSILFGIAHSHHYISQSYVNTELRRVNARAAVEQMTYTTLFGVYASVLYLKSRFILTPILIHSYCNLMGLPDFEALVSTRYIFYITCLGFMIWFCALIHTYSSL